MVNSGTSGTVEKSGTLATKLPAVDIASLGLQEIPAGESLQRNGGCNQEEEVPLLMTFLELLDPSTSCCFILVCSNLF